MQTVLVVESEPTDLLALALILRSLGYTVLEADSTDEAISACREHPGPIQLVVTEATLDNKDAREFVGRLRSLCPRNALSSFPTCRPIAYLMSTMKTSTAAHT
jgi:CheY-like chemotaxis protein